MDLRIAPWRWEDPINRSHTNPPPRYVVSGGNDDSIPVVFVLPTTCKNTSVGSLGLFRGKGSLGYPQPNTHGARECHSPLGYTTAEPNVQLSFNHLMEHVPKVPPKALLDLERIRGRVDEEPCSRPERASGLNHPRTPVPESPSPRNLTLALIAEKVLGRQVCYPDQTTTSLLVEFSSVCGWPVATAPPPLLTSSSSHLAHLFTSTPALSYRGRGISPHTGLVPELSRPCCERALSDGPPMAMGVWVWAILPRLRCSRLHGAALRYLVGTHRGSPWAGAAASPNAAPWYRKKRLERDGGGVAL